MAGAHIEIKTNNIPKVEAELDAAIERALITVGVNAEKYAKALCPVGTPESTGIDGYIGGTLRNSITFATVSRPGTTIRVNKGQANPKTSMHGGREEAMSNNEKNSVIVGTNVYYAPYVELGTRHVGARPFLRPAIEDHINEFKQIIESELKKG